MKEFLSQKGVAFQEKDVAVDQDAAMEMVQKSGQMGVPVTVLDREVVVGFNRERLEEILGSMSASRPPFGLRIADARTIAMKQGGLPVFGAYVGEVRPGSIAGRLGLKPGDIITELNMQPIHTSQELEASLSKLTTGARIQLVFARGGQTLSAEGVYR